MAAHSRRSIRPIADGVVTWMLVPRCRWNKYGNGVLHSLSWASNRLSREICFPGQHMTLTVTQSDTTPDGTDVEAVSSNPAGTRSAFRNDGAGTCPYNLGTKNMSPGDWYLHINAGDGVDHATRFSLRK